MMGTAFIAEDINHVLTFRWCFQARDERICCINSKNWKPLQLQHLQQFVEHSAHYDWNLLVCQNKPFQKVIIFNGCTRSMPSSSFVNQVQELNSILSTTHLKKFKWARTLSGRSPKYCLLSHGLISTRYCRSKIASISRRWNVELVFVINSVVSQLLGNMLRHWCLM